MPTNDTTDYREAPCIVTASLDDDCWAFGPFENVYAANVFASQLLDLREDVGPMVGRLYDPDITLATVARLGTWQPTELTAAIEEATRDR